MDKINTEESQRPWGYYDILSDSDDCKVKRITVYPGKRLSLQRHQRRSEHWYIVQGSAMVTLDSNTYVLESGGSIDIPKNCSHRIQNQGATDLVFIEVQTGEYFGEDDIERLEDDFGRI